MKTFGKFEKSFGAGETKRPVEDAASLEGKLFGLIAKRGRLINETDNSLSDEERSNAIMDLNRDIADLNERIRKLREKRRQSSDQ